MISQEDLDLLLIDIETDRVERTISIKDPKKFGEAICSFANDLSNNRKPGYLIIGANDDGSIAGLTIAEKTIQSLLDYRTDGRIVPPPAMSVGKFTYANGELAVVEVQPSFQTPVRFEGKVCIRVGPRRGIANEAEERILSEKRSSYAKTFDTTPAYGSSIDDLSVDIFKINYLPNAIDKETLEANHREISGQLASLKFYDLIANCPTNAGVLMFGKNPRFYLPGAYLQYVRFTGTDEVSDFDFERAFEGDLTTQMRVIDEFINSQIIKRKAVLLKGTLREEYIYNYPARSLRELVYNAIIHRDYQSNAPIKFYEFSDRIEITNPGGLYGDARPENFPNKNDYRNPTLAEASKNLGYVNSFNVGVKRALAELVSNGNPKPDFITNQATSFGVTIYKKQDV